MDLLEFKIGNLLRLDIFDDKGLMIDRVFVSQVEEIIDGYEAIIAAPIVEGVIYAVRVGWVITVYLQEGNSFHRFSARVIERMQQDGRAVVRILRLSEIEIVQRRGYYRFKCSIPFQFTPAAAGANSGEAEPVVGKTIDISGSGLSFTSLEKLAAGDIIDCVLTINEKPLHLAGLIKRCNRVFDEYLERLVYNVGVYFQNIEEAKREIIIKYIFNEERRQLSMYIA